MAHHPSDYRVTAAQMRAMAAKESDPDLKRKLLDLADQYDKLTKRAEQRNE
jgi:hypothetical protein